MKDDSRLPAPGLRVEPHAPHRPCPARPTLLLLADGDIAHRQSIASQLRQRQFIVIETGTGVDAVEAAAQKHPDLIFISVRLPDSDGVDTIHQLKAEPGTAGIPIVALGSLALRHERNRCQAAGAVDWIAKPTTAGEMVSVIEKHLLGVPIPGAAAFY